VSKKEIKVKSHKSPQKIETKEKPVMIKVKKISPRKESIHKEPKKVTPKKRTKTQSPLRKSPHKMVDDSDDSASIKPI